MSTSQTDKDLEIFYPSGKEIEIAGEKFTIKPFVLRNRIKVVQILAEIMGAVSQGKVNLNNPNEAVIGLIKAAGERTVDIYEIVLGKDKDWLENQITLKDEVLILKTIFEVNDFPFLLSQVQDLIKLGKKQA